MRWKMSDIYHKAEDVVSSLGVLTSRIRENSPEARVRKQNGFHSVEADLPDVKKIPAKDQRPTVGNDILSHLGSLNPFAANITDDDTVWLFDNTAYRNPASNEWQAEFVAAVFDQDTGLEVTNVVANIAEKLGIARGDEAEATIRERLMMFMRTILPGRRVEVSFEQIQDLTLGPGGRNAISSDLKTLPQHSDGDFVPSTATVPRGADGVLEMKTVFAEPEGWAVISDIDDTIKLTQTSNPIGILMSTFVSPPTAITGMPELYAYIQSIISDRSPFFYLSASPYNLYPFLKDFREQFYPHGTIILRDASWMNLAGLLQGLTVGTQEYKVVRMTKIHEWLPNRKMICIGDSTQFDPESYAEMYRNNYGWVRLILIRKVTNIAAGNIEEKNEPQRFAKAFDGIPEDVWHVFETPEECYQIIRNLVSSTD